MDSLYWPSAAVCRFEVGPVEARHRLSGMPIEWRNQRRRAMRERLCGMAKRQPEAVLLKIDGRGAPALSAQADQLVSPWPPKAGEQLGATERAFYPVLAPSCGSAMLSLAFAHLQVSPKSRLMESWVN